VPASHQLLIPATNVNGISLAGGNALWGAAREGTAELVAVAAAEDMRTFPRIIVGRIMVERRGTKRERRVELRGTSDGSTTGDL